MTFLGFDYAAAKKRLEAWPLFDPEVYLRMNVDVRPYGPGPADHFIRYGCWTGRRFTNELRLSAALGRMPHPELTDPVVDLDILSKLDIGIYTSSRSNFFMREIGRLLVDGLRNLGASVTEGDETSHPAHRARHAIIVAPHEFFILGQGQNWAQADVVGDVIMLSTEQPQTSWFATSLPYLLTARGVLEMCWQTSRSFEQAGMQSSFHMPGLPLHWTDRPQPGPDVLTNDLIQTLPQAAFDFDPDNRALWARPINVTFMASESTIRNDFLGRHMATLRDLQTLLVYRRVGHTVPKGYASDDLVTEVNDFIFRRSKILLNIHRDSIGYFEAHRLCMQGIWNACAVVTNKCLPHPYFKPGEHYFEETLDRIPKLLRWLIQTPEGRREAETVRWRALTQCAAVCGERQQARRVAEFLIRCFAPGGIA